MQNLLLAITISLLSGCGLLGSVPVQSALEVLGPMAADALERAAKKRWGDDAAMDLESAACFPADDSVAESFGDDYEEFEYISCRIKAD